MYSIFMSVSFSWILFILPTNSQRSRTLLHSIQDGIMCWIGVSLHINIGVSGPYSAPKQMYITAYKYASGPASMAQHFKFTLVFRIFTMRYAKRVDYIRMCTYHRIHMHQNEGCAMRHIRRRTAKKSVSKQDEKDDIIVYDSVPRHSMSVCFRAGWTSKRINKKYKICFEENK